MSNEAFNCRACGACCKLPGYVRLREGEAERIAAFLGVDAHGFIQTQTRLTHDRQNLSLLEDADHACVFLTPENQCRIHAVKPAQCRGYPSQWRTEILDAICPAQLSTKGEQHA